MVLRRFGADMWLFRDQIGGADGVWCRYVAFPGPNWWGDVVCAQKGAFSGTE